ncbi:MAG: SLC13 family permease, partial [Pyrinomonadaceae bacterium]
VSPSKLMIPLAFSTVLGGTATLLTTSNIVLSSLLSDNNIEGFSLVDFAPVGIPIIIVGIAYVALVGRKLLPGESMIERTTAPITQQSDDLITTYHLGKNLFRARVPENSFLNDKTLAECTLREDFGVSVVAVERGGKRLFAIAPDTVIRRNDILILEGDEENFRRRDVEPFMEFLPTKDWHEEDLESRNIEVVEAMLAPRSRLIDRTLRSSHFREKYGMSVLALWRGDEEIYTDIADIPLLLGDALLLQGARKNLPVLRDDPDLILLLPKEGEITVPNKGRAALMIVIATLAFAVIFPNLTGVIMLGGALAMMLTGILTMEQAYSSVSWKSVFLVAGILPLGIALIKTNAAALMAGEIVSIFGAFGTLALLAGLFILTALLTQAMSGAAVAAVIGPIAIQVAQTVGANPRSLTMGIALAASMASITPLSHPVNILVMGPGGYNFRDYFKIGLPLFIILFVLIMLILPLVWSL